MNTAPSPSSQALAQLAPESFSANTSGLFAFLTPHACGETMLFLAAHLARRGPLRIFDGGNCLKAYALARGLYRLGCRDIESALQRVQVQRAFTCYQVVALMQAAPAHPVPILALDLLGTFYDENVPLFERRYLLEGCLEQLQRLSAAALVVVSLRPPPQPQVDARGFLECVQSAASCTWFQEELPRPEPLRLF